MDLVPFFTVFILVIAGIFYKFQNQDESIDKISDVIGTEDLCDDGSKESNITREIFFLETSGEECLAVRQACSVESVSLTNPDTKIVVRMEGTGIIPGEFYAKWKSGRKGRC